MTRHNKLFYTLYHVCLYIISIQYDNTILLQLLYHQSTSGSLVNYNNQFTISPTTYQHI